MDFGVPTIDNKTQAKATNDDVTITKASSGTTAPTSFLSLPSELRQPILVEAILFPLIFPDLRFDLTKYVCWDWWAESVGIRAAVIRKVHSDISDDVDYVKQKAIEWLDEQCREKMHMPLAQYENTKRTMRQ